jgi:hypothetical protein
MTEDYKYKTNQLIKIPYPAADGPQTASFYVNSTVPIDKIRVSVSGDLNMSQLQPGILVYSTLVNNYIGTIGTKFNYATASPDYIFSDKLEPSEGMEYFFQNQVALTGEYSINLTNFAGNTNTVVNSSNEDDIYLLIEYYQL